MKGVAKFISNHVVEVNGVKYASENICIASGFKPKKYDWEGAELTSDCIDFFEMKVLPKRAVVIGGGFVAIELGQILQGFGVQTTMCVRSVLLRELGLDDDIHQVMFDNMKKSGLDIRIGAPFDKVTKNENGSLNVILKSGDVLECDQVFTFLQFPATVDGMGLENTEVKIDENDGNVIVDDFN